VFLKKNDTNSVETILMMMVMVREIVMTVIVLMRQRRVELLHVRVMLMGIQEHIQFHMEKLVLFVGMGIYKLTLVNSVIMDIGMVVVIAAQHVDGLIQPCIVR